MGQVCDLRMYDRAEEEVDENNTINMETTSLK